MINITADSLKQIFSKIQVFDKKDTDRAVGIDIGSSSIKVVEIKKKGGKAVLETYGTVSLGPYAEKGEIGQVTNLPVEKIVEALKEVLQQAETTTPVSALAIPVQASLIFHLNLPANISESEMSSVIPIEARKYIPVPITEVSLDYFALPSKESSFEELHTKENKISKNEEDKKEILVIAIQNEVISKYRSIASQSNLNPDFFELEIFSSVRANLEHDLSLILLMDFGASRTRFSLIEFGTIKAYHTIDRGGANITESLSRTFSIPFSKAEEMKKEFGLLGGTAEKNFSEIIKSNLDYIFSETNNILLGYEKKYKQTISKVIFTGGGAMLKGLPEMAIANFQAEVEIGRPFRKVGTPAFLDKVLQVVGPEFSTAIGLALRKLQ